MGSKRLWRADGDLSAYTCQCAITREWNVFCQICQGTSTPPIPYDEFFVWEEKLRGKLTRDEE